MKWFKDTLEITTPAKGLHSITSIVSARIHNWNIYEGICYLFIQHTSASLVINENYDPSAKDDMETFLNKLAPENQNWYRHIMEGSDDSPAHLKSIITPTSQVIPIDDGELSLGTWQGIYLFEHRNGRQRRHILIRCLSTAD